MGTADQMNLRQLGVCLPVFRGWDKVDIAYERVWAIDAGKVVTPAAEQEARKASRYRIRAQGSYAVADGVRINNPIRSGERHPQASNIDAARGGAAGPDRTTKA